MPTDAYFKRHKLRDPVRRAASQAAYRERKRNDPMRDAQTKACLRAYYLRHKDRLLKMQRDRQVRLGAKFSEQQRWYGIKFKHGINKERFDEMLAAQNGVCAICGGSPTGRNKQWHIDHDHETDEIRGLLCMHCNHAMERIDNIPGWAFKAAEYKAKHS